VIAVDVVVEVCAGLDIGKRKVQACVRGPDGTGGGRRVEVLTFDTFTGSLEALRDWLVAEGVTEVAMEATGPYWKGCCGAASCRPVRFASCGT